LACVCRARRCRPTWIQVGTLPLVTATPSTITATTFYTIWQNISSSPYKKTLTDSLARPSKKTNLKTATKRKADNGPCVFGKATTRPGPKTVKQKLRTGDDDICSYCHESDAESVWTQCQVCLQSAHDICAGISKDQHNFVSCVTLAPSDRMESLNCKTRSSFICYARTTWCCVHQVVRVWIQW